MSFVARYYGECSNKCGNPIEVGQLIEVKRLDKFQHVDCIDRPEEAPEPNEHLYTTDDPVAAETIVPGKYGVCGSCHIELPATRVCGFC